MRLDPIKFSIHHWNLDGLRPSKPKAQGKKSPEIPLSDGLGPLRRVGLVKLLSGDEQVLVLRSKKQQMVQCLDLGAPKTSSIVKTWSNREIVDMAVAGGFVYVLDRSNNRIESFPFAPRRDGLSPRFWSLDSIGITPHSKLALIKEDADELPHTAYVGSGREGRLFSVSLDDSRIVEVDVSIPAEPKTLGKEIYLCPDPENRTLLVSDTNHHRILEVNCAEGTASVLCGTGQPGRPEEGMPAALAPVSSPRALALYRHQDVISEELIHPDLRAIFSYDHERVRPRTILFVDSGSSSVKKIIDFPRQAEDLHEAPAGMVVYSLLGSPQKVLGGLFPGSKTDDLRNYPITKPIDLAVTDAGELIVASENPPSILPLRPATSLDERAVQIRSRKSKVGVPS